MKNMIATLNTTATEALTRIIENTEQNPFGTEAQRNFVMYAIRIIKTGKTGTAYTKMMELYYGKLEFVSAEFATVVMAVNAATLTA